MVSLLGLRGGEGPSQVHPRSLPPSLLCQRPFAKPALLPGEGLDQKVRVSTSDLVWSPGSVGG